MRSPGSSRCDRIRRLWRHRAGRRRSATSTRSRSQLAISSAPLGCTLAVSSASLPPTARPFSQVCSPYVARIRQFFSSTLMRRRKIGAARVELVGASGRTRMPGRLAVVCRSVSSCTEQATQRHHGMLPGVAVVKLTSGSTGAPRGVVMRAEHVLADEAALFATMGLRDRRPSARCGSVLAFLRLHHARVVGSGSGLDARDPRRSRALFLALRRARSRRDCVSDGAGVHPGAAEAVPAAGVACQHPPRDFSGRVAARRDCRAVPADLRTAGACVLRIERMRWHLLRPRRGRGRTRNRRNAGRWRSAFGETSRADRRGRRARGGGVPWRGRHLPARARSIDWVPVVSRRAMSLRGAEKSLSATTPLDRVINVRGRKVDPSEVEMVLSALEGVAEVVVLGVPSPDGRDEIVRAVVACPSGRPSYPGVDGVVPAATRRSQSAAQRRVRGRHTADTARQDRPVSAARTRRRHDPARLHGTRCTPAGGHPRSSWPPLVSTVPRSPRCSHSPTPGS